MRYHRTRPPIVRAAVSDPSAARRLRRLHAAGKLVRLHARTYIDTQHWRSLSESDRHLVRAWAMAPVLGSSATFSHQTAALIHGWPFVGPLPDRVHVVDPSVPGVQHRAGVVSHGHLPVPLGTAPARFDGVPVTDVLTTAVAVALTSEPHMAAVAVDHPVRCGALTVEDFRRALPLGPSRGSRRAQLVADSLDARHESPGESLTAVRLRESGVERIEPQRVFRHGGGSDRVDFWLPDLGVIVEFDGKQKYTDPSMRAGLSAEDALWREKLREDRLRRQPEVTAVIRPTWWHLVHLDRFRALFRSHGVRL